MAVAALQAAHSALCSTPLTCMRKLWLANLPAHTHQPVSSRLLCGLSWSICRAAGSTPSVQLARNVDGALLLVGALNSTLKKKVRTEVNTWKTECLQLTIATPNALQTLGQRCTAACVLRTGMSALLGGASCLEHCAATQPPHTSQAAVECRSHTRRSWRA